MNTSLRLLLGMAILSIPAVGLQALRPGWLQDARRELGVLRESRERVTTEGERKERLAEATTSATARLAAKQRLVMDLVAEVTTLAEVARQFKALDATVAGPLSAHRGAGASWRLGTLRPPGCRPRGAIAARTRPRRPAGPRPSAQPASATRGPPGVRVR